MDWLVEKKVLATRFVNGALYYNVYSRQTRTTNILYCPDKLMYSTADIYSTELVRQPDQYKNSVVLS